MRYQKLAATLVFALAASQILAAEKTRVTVAPTAAAHTPVPGEIARGQLPLEIMLDSHLLRAEEAVRQRDLPAARAAMEQIAALLQDHDLQTPTDYHYRYAVVWNTVGAWDQSLASAVRYLGCSFLVLRTPFIKAGPRSTGASTGLRRAAPLSRRTGGANSCSTSWIRRSASPRQ